MKKMYDLVVVGGGPAGVTAATTAARHGLNVMLAAGSLQGKLSDIGVIENWPGDERVSGKQLAARLAKQVEIMSSAIDYRKARVTKIRNFKQLFLIALETEETVTTRAIVLAMGIRQGTLKIAGETELLHKGVSYCVACDAPYYKGKNVAVISQRPQTASMAKQLARVVSHVYFFQLGPAQPAVLGSNITTIPSKRIVRIVGDSKVIAVRYETPGGGKTNELAVDGAFIAAESVPNTELVTDLVDLDIEGYVKVDHQTMSTSKTGIFAAGDITNSPHKQITTAVGDGTKASLSAIKYITDDDNTREAK